MTTKALVVLSGGQDSTTCLFWAKQYFDEVHAITFDYGQRHRLELDAAQTVARQAQVVSHYTVGIPGLLKSTSPLVNSGAKLETYTDFKSMDKTIGNRVELTFVPMRNALFLNIAANYAISMGIRTLVTGVCEADNANYPDCRKAFIDAQMLTINMALGINDFVIETPLIHMSKRESIRLAMSLPGCTDALAFSHTCYSGQFPPCGKCHSCVLRAHGFEEAGVIDPLLIRANGGWYAIR